MDNPWQGKTPKWMVVLIFLVVTGFGWMFWYTMSFAIRAFANYFSERCG